MRFDPHQYALDSGWSYTEVCATAEQGVAEEDLRRLRTEYPSEDGAADALLAWCRAAAAEEERCLAGKDLTEADLTAADLTDANLAGADLTNANLTDANLAGADLTCANLTRANLTRANLTRANLTGAVLEGADLSDADLAGAVLEGAYLTGAFGPTGHIATDFVVRAAQAGAPNDMILWLWGFGPETPLEAVRAAIPARFRKWAL